MEPTNSDFASEPPNLEPYDCSEAERLTAEAFTRIRRIVSEDEPEAHAAWLVVDQQSFCITPDGCETAASASWTCWMLAKALLKITSATCKGCMCFSSTEALTQEVAELLAESFRHHAYFETQGKYAGWWDTQGVGRAWDLGQRLVELGLWECHPDGYGRRWWYRPLP